MSTVGYGAIGGLYDAVEKYFLAIEDGTRESTQSWREVLLKLKSRGINTPKLAIGDKAMGFRHWMNNATLKQDINVVGHTKQPMC